MRAILIGALAREMAAAVRTMPAGGPVAQILCLTVTIEAPARLADHWDPDRIDIATATGGWRRRLRRLPPIRWIWPLPPERTLFIAVTRRGVRITLDGLRADASTINDGR